jgi:glycosyltransferase involved in cell wall biosynthesis
MSHKLSLAIYMQDLSGGGVERQTLQLAGLLCSAQLSVSIVVNQAVGELRELCPQGVELVDLACSRTLHAIPKLVAFIRERTPDVLLSNLDYNNVAALLANIIARGKTRLIICQHNSLARDYGRTKGWSHRFIPVAYRFFSAQIARAVAVSGGIETELQNRAHLPADKVVLIHNPVIGENFENKAAQPIRRPWVAPPGSPVFITAGRLVPAKDHQTLIRAFAICREKVDSRLIVLGEGELRDSLRELCDELQIGEYVYFLGFQENPLPFFREADAFVLSSYSEGFGNVLVEALGCGTPVISTNCPHGPAEILGNGEYGILVPTRDAHKLADAMAQVATLRSRWPADILKKRANVFTAAACASAYKHLFEDVLGI